MLHDPKMRAARSPADQRADAGRPQGEEIPDFAPKMWGGSNPGSCIVARLLRWATRNNAR
jgi:hypothetical protein